MIEETTTMAEKTAQELYAERKKRIEDAVALREPDRVPFYYASRFWAASLAGLTFKEFMYDADKAIEATRKAVRMLDPDAFSAAVYAFGHALETLDFKPMRWPGHGADVNATFQYIDKEFMSAKEYDDYLRDPTSFTLRQFLPRIAGALEGLTLFPDIATRTEWDIITCLRAFADPKLQASIEAMIRAGVQVNDTQSKIGAFARSMIEEGFTIAAGGFCKSPFDHLLDSLRGSKGGMLDMFRNRDKLMAAIERAEALIVRSVAEGAKAVGCPYIFMPLHWGLDGFMSQDQFKTFYWPPLRRIMMYLIERDCVPCVLWEGNCSTRLEHIADIPRGKAVYWFEATDMVRAKDVLGDIVCLRGNVPASLLNTGTPDDVDAYCKNLIKKVGKGGGFMLDGAASIPDEAKVENVLAMANSVKKYAN